MPPRRTGRAAAANTENVKVNGDVAAPKPRGRGRPKKDVNANKDAGDKADDILSDRQCSISLENGILQEPSSKRKKEEPSDEESEPKEQRARPAPKKVKTVAKPSARGRGRKLEINQLRYVDPLKVFLFGEGSSGELGFGATKKAIDVKRPRFNEALTNMNVVRIATGGMHVVALTKDNKILTWGVNDNGALGRDTADAVVLKDMDAGSDSDSEDDPTGGLNEKEATPTPISDDCFPKGTTFVEIAAGDSCSFALTTEGAVYGWGTFRKNEGVLGFTKAIRTAWRPILLDSIKKIVNIACGSNHVVAIDKDNKVWAWGSGQQNQLGRRVIERKLEESLMPNPVGFHDPSFKRASRKLVTIACGDYHSLAIADDGHVWAWGANNYAETGNPENAGDDSASVPAPRVIKSLEGKRVKALAAGSHHNMAITESGELLAWGRCDSSQTGIPTDLLDTIDDKEKLLKAENGRPKILIEPTRVPGLKDIRSAACGPDHTIALDKDGKAYSWGFSANYQTGQGTDDDINLPTRIENTAVRDTKLVWAGAGGQFSILASLKEDSV